MSFQSSEIRILMLSANPKGQPLRRLDQEVRDIEEGLRRSQLREQFDLQQRWAVRPRDVQQAMHDFKPQIVHFSGHGTGEPGLVFEDEAGKPKLVSGEALARLFGLFTDHVDCVVLNGCYSATQAEAIAQQIPYVIGMSDAIGDRVAVSTHCRLLES
jgi:CHAT domain-containing protein